MAATKCGVVVSLLLYLLSQVQVTYQVNTANKTKLVTQTKENL